MVDFAQAGDQTARKTAHWRLLGAAALVAGLVGALFGRQLPKELSNEPAAAAEPFQPAEALRKPVAFCWCTPDRLLLTANRRSATVSVVDVVAGHSIAEAAVGERLSDVVPLGDGRQFLVLDDRRHEAIIVRVDVADDARAPRIEIAARGPTSLYPTRAVVLHDERTAAVACLWSRSVDVLELPTNGEASAELSGNTGLRVARSIALPFNPQEIAAWPSATPAEADWIIVADAFGGSLAVVDTTAGRCLQLFTFDGHNLRGLVVDAERGELLIAHQRLNSSLPTTVANLQPGKLTQNVLRRIPLAALRERMEPRGGESGMSLNAKPLNGVGSETVLDADAQGAADPDAVVVRPDGACLVLLAGVNQLARVGEAESIVRRCDVGVRPLDVVADSAFSQAYVLNSLDDTVSVVDLRDSTPTWTITLGPRPVLWPRDRGERLFYDARPARGVASCHSCHTEGHANGLLADTHSDGSYETPKRIPTLLGTSLTDTWAWNGELRELRDQVGRSFEETMHAPPLAAEQYDDVVAYLHTLPFPPPAEPVDRNGDDASDLRQWEVGREVFEREQCGQCHVPSLTFTSPGAYDVGLRDERGMTKFNPPSLRGVGQGLRYFHDGRSRTLDDVLRKERHQVNEELNAGDAKALLRYLRSL